MDFTWAQDSIAKVARQEGVSEETVIAEIEAAIAEARRAVYAQGDQRRIAMWETIPCAGETPTAVEFVTFMSAVVDFIEELGKE